MFADYVLERKAAVLRARSLSAHNVQTECDGVAAKEAKDYKSVQQQAAERELAKARDERAAAKKAAKKRPSQEPARQSPQERVLEVVREVVREEAAREEAAREAREAREAARVAARELVREAVREAMREVRPLSVPVEAPPPAAIATPRPALGSEGESPELLSCSRLLAVGAEAGSPPPLLEAGSSPALLEAGSSPPLLEAGGSVAGCQVQSPAAAPLQALLECERQQRQAAEQARLAAEEQLVEQRQAHVAELHSLQSRVRWLQESLAQAEGSVETTECVALLELRELLRDESSRLETELQQVTEVTKVTEVRQ